VYLQFNRGWNAFRGVCTEHDGVDALSFVSGGEKLSPAIVWWALGSRTASGVPLHVAGPSHASP